jgi:hypothetical protein
MRVLIALQYYKSENEERNTEIDYCLNKNLSNPEIDGVLLLLEDGSIKYPDSPKILTSKISSRAKYSDFVKFYNQSDFDVLIIINSDIFILESDIQLIKQNLKAEEVYALSRWDIKKGGIVEHYDNWGSQDTWIIKGKVKPGRYSVELGKPGCDNRIAYIFKMAGYDIKNPSKDIKTYHYHLSDYRTYNCDLDKVKGKYFYINPTKINE